jgi:hypothetical protein
VKAKVMGKKRKYGTRRPTQNAAGHPQITSEVAAPGEVEPR